MLLSSSCNKPTTECSVKTFEQFMKSKVFNAVTENEPDDVASPMWHNGRNDLEKHLLLTTEPAGEYIVQHSGKLDIEISETLYIIHVPHLFQPH